MFRPNSPAFYLLMAVLVLSRPVPAAEGNFQILRGSRELPEMGVFPEFAIVTGASRITVLQPRNSQAEADVQARKLKFLLPGYTGTVVLQLSTNCPCPGPITSEKEPELLQLVHERFPGATVRSVGVAHVGRDLGWMFDIERMTEYNTRLTTRLAFVSIPDGMLEASLTGSRYSFSSLERTFTTFLGCVQIRDANPAHQKGERPREDSNAALNLVGR
jgi:hypothetical protein